jgi:hypothetical protein
VHGRAPALEEQVLGKTPRLVYFSSMKSLTVEEATPGLGRLVDLALAGEQIQIRKGNGVVELRPAEAVKLVNDDQLSPREALRRLQEDGRLTPPQAERYLNEVREERLAAENGRPA